MRKRFDIYLAGPITARTKYGWLKNLRRFTEKAHELRSMGFTVYSPPESEPPSRKWEYYIAKDLTWMIENKPKAIYLMRGWRKSSGARLEQAMAKRLKMEIIYEE